MTGRARLVTAVLAAALLAAFLVQCLAFARANAQTYDEGVEVAAGLRLLETGADDINLEHPPLSKWLVAWPVHHFALPHLDVGPWRARRESAFGLGRDLFHNSGVAPERLLWLARLPVIGTALLVVLLTGTLAWRLWGPRAGVLALALAAFDPTLVAHGALASTDMPLTLCVVAAYACLGEWLRSWRLSWLCLAGVAVGLAAATKFSGPLFAGGLGVALVVSALADRVMPAWWAPTDPARTRPTAVLAALANGALLTLLGLLTLRLLLGAGGWPSFLVGLQAQLAHQAAGHPAFFLGRLSIDGWLLYFPLALAMKLPPLTLAAAMASVVWWTRGAAWGHARALVVAPLAVMCAALLTARIDIGVRYALPLWPLFIVLASRVATWPLPSARVATAAVVALLAHHAAAAVRIAPHDLAYFSDLFGGPSRGIWYLADSNLDWGQDLSTLRGWLDAHEPPRRLYLSYFGTADPRGYGIAYVPAPNSCAHQAPWTPAEESATGRDLLAVSAMNLQGVYFGDANAYAWLRRRTPLAVLGYSIYIYDITGDADAHESLGQMYDRFGPPDRAAAEFARAALLRTGLREAPDQPAQESALSSPSDPASAAPTIDLTTGLRLSDRVEWLRVSRQESGRTLPAFADGATYGAAALREHYADPNIGVLHRVWAFGPQLWDAVGSTRQPSAGEVRKGIWAHPRNGSTLVIDTAGLRTGARVHGFVGLTDWAVQQARDTHVTSPVTFRVSLDGRHLVDVALDRAQGWTAWDMPAVATSQGHALRVEVSAASDAWADLVFDLFD